MLSDQVGAELESPFGSNENNLALLAIGSDLCKNLDTLSRSVGRVVKGERERIEHEEEVRVRQERISESFKRMQGSSPMGMQSTFLPPHFAGAREAPTVLSTAASRDSLPFELPRRLQPPSACLRV